MRRGANESWRPPAPLLAPLPCLTAVPPGSAAASCGWGSSVLPDFLLSPSPSAVPSKVQPDPSTSTIPLPCSLAIVAEVLEQVFCYSALHHSRGPRRLVPVWAVSVLLLLLRTMCVEVLVRPYNVKVSCFLFACCVRSTSSRIVPLS